MREKLLSKFYELYGSEGDVRTYFAPGRVNLIGEHTDYNGGHVFPCALTLGTYGVARKRNDGKLRFYSMNFEEMGVLEADISELRPEDAAGWTNYPKGMIWALKEKGYSIDKGMDMLLFGDIPNASGLSSSASVEVLTGVVLSDLFELSVSMTEIALTGQFSENRFNGVNCGIMDQFAIAMGKKDHAIFLDTSDLTYEYAPLILKDEKIIIACSNKKRGLGDSKYNERRQECETALQELQQVVQIHSLGELTEELFEKYQWAIKDETRQRRAKHAVYENQRTIRAVEALKNNNLELFGKLLNASHASLRDDYEVTGVELDTLAEEAWKVEGVLGSRMTGAGFGGCTVSIVKNAMVDSFIQQVGQAYESRIGYKADFYVVEVGPGAAKMTTGAEENLND